MKLNPEMRSVFDIELYVNLKDKTSAEFSNFELGTFCSSAHVLAIQSRIYEIHVYTCIRDMPPKPWHLPMPRSDLILIGCHL